MNEPLCPETGEPMTRGVQPLTLSYKGQHLTVSMPGWYCGTCEESLHVGDDMKVSDRALNLLKARSEGLLEPEVIKRIRRKLEWTQAEAGKFLGGGPRAFQKYESGDLLPSRALCNLLILADDNPKAIRSRLEQSFNQRLAESKKLPELVGVS